MTEPPPSTGTTSLPTGLAHGSLEDGRWAFGGKVPDRAARIEIETDTDTTYSVPCDETHWALALDRGDLPSAVKIQALAIDGTPVFEEVCFLTSDTPRQPSRRWWRRRHSPRGWTRYGPGSR